MYHFLSIRICQVIYCFLCRFSKRPEITGLVLLMLQMIRSIDFPATMTLKWKINRPKSWRFIVIIIKHTLDVNVVMEMMIRFREVLVRIDQPPSYYCGLLIKVMAWSIDSMYERNFYSSSYRTIVSFSYYWPHDICTCVKITLCLLLAVLALGFARY